jgi:hypothetical protein
METDACAKWKTDRVQSAKRKEYLYQQHRRSVSLLLDRLQSIDIQSITTMVIDQSTDSRSRGREQCFGAWDRTCLAMVWQGSRQLAETRFPLRTTANLFNCLFTFQRRDTAKLIVDYDSVLSHGSKRAIPRRGYQSTRETDLANEYRADDLSR